MKFSEIEELPFASYKVDIPWDCLEEWIENKKNRVNMGIDLDPPYQRGYVWNEEQKSAYVEYMLRGGFSGKDIFWNCSSWQGEYNTPLQLVDGKQRLNAVIGFLNNEVKVFGCYLKDFEDKIPIWRFGFVFHINRIESQKDVVKWYIGMNTGGSIHTEKDLKVAYDYLESL